ncbi:hypothetical protein HPB47_015075, partial [Ixodes persulcatus]
MSSHYSRCRRRHEGAGNSTPLHASAPPAPLDSGQLSIIQTAHTSDPLHTSAPPDTLDNCSRKVPTRLRGNSPPVEDPPVGVPSTAPELSLSYVSTASTPPQASAPATTLEGSDPATRAKNQATLSPFSVSDGARDRPALSLPPATVFEAMVRSTDDDDDHACWNEASLATVPELNLEMKALAKERSRRPQGGSEWPANVTARDQALREGQDAVATAVGPLVGLLEIDLLEKVLDRRTVADHLGAATAHLGRLFASLSQERRERVIARVTPDLHQMVAHDGGDEGSPLLFREGFLRQLRTRNEAIK